MKPKQLIEKWVIAFNNADTNTLIVIMPIMRLIIR